MGFFDAFSAFGQALNPYTDAAVKIYSAKANNKIATATAKQSAALAAQAQADNQQLALTQANALKTQAQPFAPAPTPIPVGLIVGGVLGLGALVLLARR
jgi:hypothetical protein